VADARQSAAPDAGDQGDAWFRWLTSRRHGGSEEQLHRGLARLAPVRDDLLAHAGLAQGESFLDVGAGDGLIAFGAIDRVGPTGLVIFSDVSTDLLERSQSIARELGVEALCRFVQASADDLSPIGDASVDVVTTRSVLIYVKDKAGADAEFHRVLRPGGRISTYEPVNRLMRRPERLWSYDVSAVTHLFAKIDALYNSVQDPDTSPMLDFDEQDILAYAERGARLSGGPPVRQLARSANERSPRQSSTSEVVGGGGDMLRVPPSAPRLTIVGMTCRDG
jgi:arsenite methyltransferase